MAVLITEESPSKLKWDFPKSKVATEKMMREKRVEIPGVIMRIVGRSSRNRFCGSGYG